MKNMIFWSNFSWVYFPAVYIRGVLCQRLMYHAHLSRQERPVSVCKCSLCIRWALMESVSSQTSAQSYKAPEAPRSACATPWGSAVSAHCGWGSSEAFLGRAASSGLSVLALGEMLPIFHVSSGITSPSQGSPQLLVAIVLYHPRKAASSPHRSGNPTDPSSPGASFVLALYAVTLFLVSGGPLTAVPSFSCEKHQ